MEVELYCSCCQNRFAAPPACPRDEILDRLTDDGPWFALAEGETFEDMIFAALLDRGMIACPECRAPVDVREVSIGRMVDCVAA
jgi:hypothetical protein